MATGWVEAVAAQLRVMNDTGVVVPLRIPASAPKLIEDLFVHLRITPDADAKLRDFLFDPLQVAPYLPPQLGKAILDGKDFRTYFQLDAEEAKDAKRPRCWVCPHQAAFVQHLQAVGETWSALYHRALLRTTEDGPPSLLHWDTHLLAWCLGLLKFSGLPGDRVVALLLLWERHVLPANTEAREPVPTVVSCAAVAYLTGVWCNFKHPRVFKGVDTYALAGVVYARLWDCAPPQPTTFSDMNHDLRRIREAVQSPSEADTQLATYGDDSEREVEAAAHSVSFFGTQVD